MLDVAWSPDGNYLATASFEGVVKLWDAATGRERQSVLGHQFAVLSVAWSRQATGWLRPATMRPRESGYLVAGVNAQCFAAMQRPLWCAVWSPDGTRVASGSDGPIAKVWDANTGRALVTLNAESMYIESLRMVARRQTFGQPARMKRLRSGRPTQGRKRRPCEDTKVFVGKVTWSPDGMKSPPPAGITRRRYGKSPLGRCWLRCAVMTRM